MKFTIDWLKQHLDTDLNDKEIINTSLKALKNFFDGKQLKISI